MNRIIRLVEELRLRKYSEKTVEKYCKVIEKFLDSGKPPKDFLMSYSNKSRSMIRGVYFALRFYYLNVLNENFDERIPLTKNSLKLPIVLNRKEVDTMFEVTKNQKHRLVLALLYYAGLRLNEVRNLKGEDLDFDRDLIHIKKAKGDKERIVFLHEKIGFKFIRQKGSHMFFDHPDGRTTVIPNHPGEKIDRGLLNKIIKHDLQMTREEFLKHS